MEEEKQITGIIFPAFIVTIFSLILLIVSSINFSRVIAETSALEAWQGVDGCVEDDIYMRISEVERSSVETQDRYARLSFAFVLMGVLSLASVIIGGVCYARRPCS